MFETPRPTPTCARFKATEMPCTICRSTMKLVLSEPRGRTFDFLTYTCVSCEAVESFLMAV